MEAMDMRCGYSIISAKCTPTQAPAIGGTWGRGLARCPAERDWVEFRV
jgi:hypothetical protein